MECFKTFPVIGQGANDIFLKIAWCPDIIKFTEWATGLGGIWYRLQGKDTAISRVAAGDRTVQTDKGFYLGHIPMKMNEMDADGDFTAFGDVNWKEDGMEANAVKIASDVVGLTDHALLMFEFYRMTYPIIRAVHDGGDACNTYIQDASIDFLELGVVSSTPPQWLVYNLTNQDYAYVGVVQKPSGQQKHCRATLVNAAGTAMAAADIDDDDVLLLLPKYAAQYPLSDYGLMS